MTVYNLPALSGNVTTPGTPGTWTELQSLEALALDLKAGEAQQQRESVRSVPDPWAQVLLAGEALANKDHELHSDITAQWRALIATVALQTSFADVYRLTVDSLPVAGDRTDDKSNPRSGGVLRDLLLGSLAPAATASEGVGWAGNTAIVSIGRVERSRVGTCVPVALAVPDILLAPGRPFRGIDIPGAPWLKGGPSDPTRAGLSADALQLVHDFATALREAMELQPASGRDAATQVALADALDKLATDCVPADVTRVPTDSRPGSHNWPAPASGALNAVAVIAFPPGTGLSDCALECRADIRSPFSSIILADPAIAGTLGRPDLRVRLFNQFMLSDVPQRLPEIKEAAAKAGHLVLAVEDALVSVIARLDRSTIPANADGARDLVLPITPLLLLVQPGEALALAAILQDRGDRVEAGVELRLNGGRAHRLVRTYGARQVERVDRLDDLGMWPNFAADSWRHYAVRAESRSGAELVLAVAASGALVAADLQERPASLAAWIASRVINLDQGEQQLGSSKPTGAKLVHFPFNPPSDRDNRGVQAWSTHAYEALFMTYKDQPVGCVVPVLARPLKDAAKTATVAVDFGTSNTIARIDRPGVGRSEVKLGARVLNPIDPAVGLERYDGPQRKGFSDFLPIDGATMPFPTIMKTRSAVVPVAETVCGATETIYFADARVGADEFEWISQGNLRADIKWDSSKEGNRRTLRFLRQLLMMIAADLAADDVDPKAIRWRFSYPNAFNKDQRDELKRAMKQACEALVGDPVAASELEVHSEGEAAMQSLVRDETLSSAGNLVLMLDIGGGTTDIAIWRGVHTLWQGSFRLAAREFFTEPLARRPEILGDAMGGLDDATRQRLAGWADEAKDGNRTRARSLVELRLNAPGFNRGFHDAFATHSRDPNWLALERTATVALGGMLWYLGRLLKHRTEWALTSADLGEITVALGGRGSTYFTHIDPEKNGRLVRIARLLAIAAGVDATPSVYFSPSPKQEVVDGLLSLPVGSTAMASVDERMILGEAVTMTLGQDRRIFAAVDDLAQVPASDASPEIDLSEMTAFLAALQKVTGHRIDLTQRIADGTLESSLKSSVRKRLNDSRRPLEAPMFILALRRLVEELARA